MMAAAFDVRQKQHDVIGFLCCENATVANIHKRLKMVYGDDAVDLSTVNGWLPDYLMKMVLTIFRIFLSAVDRNYANF